MLGKGLKRVIGARVGDIVINKNLVGSFYAGGVLGRLAVDLVRALVERVELLSSIGKASAGVIIDVKGAFNAVRPEAIYKALRECGFPGKVEH